MLQHTGGNRRCVQGQAMWDKGLALQWAEIGLSLEVHFQGVLSAGPLSGRAA